MKKRILNWLGWWEWDLWEYMDLPDYWEKAAFPTGTQPKCLFNKYRADRRMVGKCWLRVRP